ncbi:hypothetical protein ACFYOT_18400 [Saccharothrix saharensis]|uniref:hypothetical protein n=1 Tax=Saccharothrix saharensis TaxID=571190 RepID=UPI0036BA1752
MVEPAGDPGAAARALLKLVDLPDPPPRVLFGTGLHPMIREACEARLKMWDHWQDRSAEAQGGAVPTDA